MLYFDKPNPIINNTEPNTRKHNAEAPSHRIHHPVPATPHYSSAAVIERFKAKHFTNGTAEKLQEMVDKAERMAQHVLNNKEPAPHLDKIYTKLSLKTGKPLTAEDKHAKLFALALKVINQFETCGEDVIFPFKVASDRGLKQAPFIKLFGKKTQFIAMTPENSTGERTGLIYTKFLGEGTFNQAQLVYDLDKGEKVMRSLRNDRLKSRDNVNDWTDDLDSHQLILDEHIPGVVNIESVFMLNDSDSTPTFRAMELEKCDGDLCALTQKLPLDKQKDIMKQLLTTFSEMHSKNIVHGDVKPNNVLYIQKPDGIETKLTDFGSVYRATQGESGTATPEYVTPEAWQQGNIGPKNTMKEDCFSLGKIALELRYGRLYDPVPRKYREELLDSNSAFRSNFQKYLKEEIDRETLLEELQIAYPNTDLEYMLDEDILKKGSKKQITEIYQLCYNAIIEAELQTTWHQNLKVILNHMMVREPDSYNKIIAQMLNPDSTNRLTAQEALKNLTALIEKEKKLSV